MGLTKPVTLPHRTPQSMHLNFKHYSFKFGLKAVGTHVAKNRQFCLLQDAKLQFNFGTYAGNSRQQFLALSKAKSGEYGAF